jgi:ATP-binding cassette subfamily B protein
MDVLASLGWPKARLGEALEALARHAGLARPSAVALPLPDDLLRRDDIDELRRWIERAAAALGAEVEAVSVGYADLEDAVRSMAPAVIGLSFEGDSFLFYALAGRRGGDVLVLAPDQRLHRVPARRFREVRFRDFERRTDEVIARVLGAAGVDTRLSARARLAWRAHYDPSVRMQNFFVLRAPPGGLRAQLGAERVARGLAALLGLHALGVALALGGWVLLGRGALRGQLEPGWFAAWLLLLASQIPAQIALVRLQGTLGLALARAFKQVLLHGAQCLEPDALRLEGSGRLLGRVIESQAAESLAIQGGFQLLTLAVQCLVTPWVLAHGAAPTYHVALFAAVLFAAVALGAAHAHARAVWSDARLELTGELVERMVGHRTLVVQQARDAWHVGEDELLRDYLESSRRMDRLRVRLAVLPARVFVILALAGLVPALSDGVDVTRAATTIGGILLGVGVMQQFGACLAVLAGAWVAWRQVEPLLRSAAAGAPTTAPGASLTAHEHRAGAPGDVLLETRELAYRYSERATPALVDCSLTLRVGDRVLLEGPSGGGKSTLAHVLGGLRRPASGLLLLNGLDAPTLGPAAWRRRVVVVPQFHENHVFTGPLAFNLLMGRRWPARSSDLADAEQVCRELGLGPLIERMPAGLFETIGETGWQLSHGERSRLYIARALLQNADLVILDESFAALDPENLERVMASVLRRAATLVVIAHP